METGVESVRADYERLAQRVRNELAAAGLPVVAPGLAVEVAVGAEVIVDMADLLFFGEGDPEVVVTWRVGPQLRSNVIADAMHQRGVTAAIRQCGEVEAAMADAVIAILSAAGFTARNHGNDLSPFDVQVLAGPQPGRRPGWALPDESPIPPVGSEAG
ncbi:hypothetical protein ACIRST_14980 [Kitasatospora sp. NPDC101447]|uniref:hypothetical protein n=1 Tax=Kitasatospora sp. NPDC101447 TaxID=3364102 RepID=UPI0037FFAF96